MIILTKMPFILSWNTVVLTPKLACQIPNYTELDGFSLVPPFDCDYTFILYSTDTPTPLPLRISVFTICDIKSICFLLLNRNLNGWGKHCTSGSTTSTARSQPMWTSATPLRGHSTSPWRRKSLTWERSCWRCWEICRSCHTRRASTARSRLPMPRWVWYRRGWSHHRMTDHWQAIARWVFAYEPL